MGLQNDSEALGLSPEDLELQSKREELLVLQEPLAERELELATLRAELQRFENRYLREVGARLRRLDELEAQLAELCANRTPEDFLLRVKARQARTQAEESAREAGNFAQAGSTADTPFVPSNDAKSLYRELAKKVHPDLAQGQAERARRTRAMADVNAAYAAGDEQKLHRLLVDWRQRPESVEGEGVAAELVRVIRKIAQGRRRLRELGIELEAEKDSDIYKLWVEAQVANTERGTDLIEEMAKELDGRIEKISAQLFRNLAASRSVTDGPIGAR